MALAISFKSVYEPLSDAFSNVLVVHLMTESFVAVCNILLKLHSLSAKFACNFNE